MKPTIGTILLYRLAQHDVNCISRQAPVTAGNNPHSTGQQLPLIVCRVFPDEFGTDKPGVNGQVFLDGRDSLWVTSVGEGEGEGQWSWPGR